MKQKKKEIKKKKSKSELKPIIEDNTNIVFDNDDFEKDDKEENEKFGEDSSENYFREIIKELFSRKNISSKTEYQTPLEQFAGSKLDFLGHYLDVPDYNKFIENWEIKRVSLLRAGRQEIVMALEKRNEDIQAQENKNNVKKWLGIE